ncbi:MAG TPA: hypothetical protein DD640_01355 [Clostridiales bacterium]|nr:hypothetical protein [Clostridiales bacterium]
MQNNTSISARIGLWRAARLERHGVPELWLLKKAKQYFSRSALYMILFALSFIFIFPFIYMLVTSVKTNADLNNVTVNWIPSSIFLKNFKYSYTILNYWIHFKNTATLTLIGTLGHIASCAFIGYGFARYKLPGKNVIFFVVLLTMIVPIQTIIVPSYMIYSNLKWINSYLPILVPTFFGYGLKGPLFIYLFRQFFLGLPKDLEDAAKIDGCNHITTYFRIIVPIAKSAFLVTLLLSLVWHWNDFYEASIYASSFELITLPSKLSLLVRYVANPDDMYFEAATLFEAVKRLDREGVINNAVLMASNLMVMAPVIISFIFLQKRFMQGIERTGLTE